VGGLGALSTEQVQNSDRELGELAVLDELAEVGKRVFLAFGNELDQIEHALNNSALEFVSTLIPQDAAQEDKHTGLLTGELQAQGADSLNNGDLEFVGDIGHEAGYLLHQTVDASFVAGLEQCGDGESGNRTVRVGDKGLDIGVADVDDVWLERSEVVEDTNGSELRDGSGGRQEELEDVNCLGRLGIGDIAHVTDSLGRLEVDHLMLVAEPAIQHLHHGFPEALVLFCQFGRQTHQQDESSRALHHSCSTILLYHLNQRHAVVRAHLIQKTDGMVLSHEI
jgi:hypothetical protein